MTSSSSRSRPTNDVSSVGRLLGRASSDRIGGKSAGRPSIDQLRDALRAQVLEPVGAERPDGDAVGQPRLDDASPVASDSSTWPPDPAAATRAARWTSWPTYAPSASSSPSPVWIPIRTRIAAPSGHGSATSERWAAATARTAPAGSRKTAKNESPSVPISRPASAASAARTSSRWRARIGRHAAVPRRSTSFVEPSMSVNRKVTSPVGRAGATVTSRGRSR